MKTHLIVRSDTISPMDAPPSPQPKKRTPAWIWVLLSLPYLGLCFPKLYVRATPTLLGFPFFYWYQLAWVIATSLLLYIAYRELKTE